MDSDRDRSDDTATPAPAATPVFSARITPHRSLDRNGFVVLMLVLGACILSTAILFAAIGAWPVLAFLAIDALIVWLAFRANFRAARAAEFVTVTENTLSVRRVAANGRTSEWTFNPYWARLSVKRDEDGVTDIAIISHGKALSIARDLAPFEKEDFAQALSAALNGVRAHPAPAPR